MMDEINLLQRQWMMQESNINMHMHLFGFFLSFFYYVMNERGCVSERGC